MLKAKKDGGRNNRTKSLFKYESGIWTLVNKKKYLSPQMSATLTSFTWRWNLAFFQITTTNLLFATVLQRKWLKRIWPWQMQSWQVRRLFCLNMTNSNLSDFKLSSEALVCYRNFLLLYLSLKNIQMKVMQMLIHMLYKPSKHTAPALS